LFWEDESTAIIICKGYMFIQWLVENDKISNDWIKPRTDLVKEITIVDYKTGDAIWWKNKYTEVEQLIMYLSIQDEPIRFLCEIIK
jgi:RecB family exonuclease